MLTHLHIRDFAIIDSTELELKSGLSALTGETGAGKSILLDAIGLVLGDRGDSGSVRQGCSRADITADFHPAEESPVWQWMQENDLDDEDQCILRRVISAEGKSRAYVNGHPVSNRVLSALGQMLVDIHGQHEHYRLTQRSTQRALLDGLLKNRALLHQVADVYLRWNELTERIDQLVNQSKQRAERIDMLRFQIQEFDALTINETELETIEVDYQRLANSGKLMELATTSLNALDNDGAAQTQIDKALRYLQELQIHDGSVGETTELINTASILVNEATATIRDYTNQLDIDPSALGAMDARLSDLHGLAKKHQCEIAALIQVRHKLQTALDEYQGDGDNIESLKDECAALRELYSTQAEKLSRARKRAAKKFDKDVTDTMQSLGMKGGSFHCEISSDSQKVTANGIDDIRFTVSANPDIEPGDLRKIASGGELSRISLAIALVGADPERVPTLIFDEVDAGIGGAVAETVGRHLRTLGVDSQVLCVTHLPQVAAQAHQHLVVTKSVKKGATQTSLEQLDRAGRVAETARMLGGTKLTRKVEQHATEMLDEAAQD